MSWLRSPLIKRAVRKNRGRTRLERWHRYSRRLENPSLTMPKTRQATGHNLPVLRPGCYEVTHALVADAIGGRRVSPSVVGKRRDGDESVVADRTPLLWHRDLAQSCTRNRAPGDRGATTLPHVERASVSKAGLIPKDELVVRQPCRTKSDSIEARVVALVVAPERPVLLIEVRAVGKVEHANYPSTDTVDTDTGTDVGALTLPRDTDADSVGFTGWHWH